jgi:alpha-beta hydrolase superfamily lysophospholipase
MIFLAPLLRSSYYHLSRVGNFIFHPFLKTTPRWFRNDSHDTLFLARFRKDPLQSTRFPLRWAAAYYSWFDHIRSSPEQVLPLTIIQGTADDVVDWRYNVRWFEEHIKGVNIITIPDGRHQLLNESPEYRNACTGSIKNVLKDVAEGRW